MSKLFISHSSEDDAFVRQLQQALGDLKQDVWIDSRELRGGDLLWPEIEKALNDASAYAVVITPESLQSKWVGKELRHAIELQKRRGKEKYPVIPISLNGTKLGVLEEFFQEEPIYIPVSSAAGGIDVALNAILVATGKRLAADILAGPLPKAEPLEDLVLELKELKLHVEDGVRRASASARLIYEPATVGQGGVSSEPWRFNSPLGPIESEELRWYLEKYAIWPSEYFRNRARKVEENLVKWGLLLHSAALPLAHTANVMNAWGRIPGHAGRRFSVYLDAAVEAGASVADIETAREAATLLLGLPWELLHDGEGFLFQGAKPTRVRRRLPNTRALDVPVVAPPIRILLVTSRPEDETCGYIDHRASALPLVEAMENLGGLVRIHALSPPTLSALRDELDRARKGNEPYDVVHFDGHGVFDRRVGLGGLCFEDPRDISRLDYRRQVTISSRELGSLLRDHRIPLVFLEACETARAERASESVASELLKVGVASVIAMSHSVLVETARRFVERFYDALGSGARVGDAMLEGQRELKDDNFRGQFFRVGDLRLEDWFVPVLFQEKADPQLFRNTHGRQTQEDLKAALNARFGELPPEPETGFIGRSRELLALQRLLLHERYAVVRGQAGEGKTALAAEFGRWMVRSHQTHRAAFVSVDADSSLAAVLDAFGRQLLPDYSVATFDNLEKAIQVIERVLNEQSTLLVVDNMESILLPPYVEMPDVLSTEAHLDLNKILKLCTRLNRKGDTRLVFTSRESLPAPFDGTRQRRELHQLDREDAVKLVERVLNRDVAGAGPAADAASEEIEQLVDAVHCHARTLALLAPSLRSHGVAATQASIVELMEEMERKFPGSREKSVFASVELSLRRMSHANRDKARVLAVFHGGVNLVFLRKMMEWEEAEVTSLAEELIEMGLATSTITKYLRLNPALCPYLYWQMSLDELKALKSRWSQAMWEYISILNRRDQHHELGVTLTVQELPNLFTLLDQVRHECDEEATIRLATLLYSLLESLGKRRLIERVGVVRDEAAAKLSDIWNHAKFEARRTLIEQQLGGGLLSEAFKGAQEMLQRARAKGNPTYPETGHDLAMAVNLLGQVLRDAGADEKALPLFDEAQKLFQDLGDLSMVAASVSRKGDCLLNLGRFDEAEVAFNEGTRRFEKLGAARDVAAGKTRLASVRLRQHRFIESVDLYHEARKEFIRLKEPNTVAGIWHQIGIAYSDAGQPQAAEDAYRESLAITVRLGNAVAQANTLGQLGILYAAHLGRTEDAVTFFRRAADKYAEIRNVTREGQVRTNLANSLRQLGRLDDARQEVSRAFQCNKQSGHAAQLWLTWNILADTETDAGNLTDAAKAKQKATECYLAYRRDGGENHSLVGYVSLAVTQPLLAGHSAAAASLIQQMTVDPKLVLLLPLIRALQAIVTGSRDRAIAADPELNYSMAAEILFLIEKLDPPEQHKP